MEQSDSDDESFTLSLPDFSDSDSHDGSGSMGTDYSDNELYNEVYDDDMFVPLLCVPLFFSLVLVIQHWYHLMVQ